MRLSLYDSAVVMVINLRSTFHPKCACVRAFVGVYVACVCVRECVHVYVRMRACVRRACASSDVMKCRRILFLRRKIKKSETCKSKFWFHNEDSII